MNKHAEPKQEDTIYSNAEMSFVVKMNKIKIFFLSPLVKFLDKIGITPNMVSIFSVIIVILTFEASYFLKNPLYFVIGIWVHIIFDALDGTLARYQKRTSQKGAIIDSICDHFGILTASLFAYMLNIVDGLNMIIFAVLYSFLMGIIFYLLKKKKNYFFVIRPRIYFYAALTIDVFLFASLTHYVVLIANMIMLTEVILGVVKILSIKKIHL